MPSRNYSLDKYRYGFNGKEKDKDINSLTAYDYGFRIYNPAIGKFLSVDPLMNSFPWYTPYQFAGNMPIWAIDLDGLEEKKATIISVVRIFDVRGNLIKTPTDVEFGATGKTILVTPSYETIQKGDEGGDVFERFVEYRQVEGIKFTIESGCSSLSIHKVPIAPPPPPPPPPPPLETLDKTGGGGTLEDKITYQNGIRVIVEEITENDGLNWNLSVPFQIESRNNPGTDFTDRDAAISQINAYSNVLRSNGVTSIIVNVSTKYSDWSSKTENHNYKTADDLLTARKKVIGAIFSRFGISATFTDRVGVPPVVSARAEKPIIKVKGYKVTTTPIVQKYVNGKPDGKPKKSGDSKISYPAIKPKKTGDIMDKRK